MSGDHRAFSNGVKPMHLVILGFFLLFRATYGGVDLRARRAANEELHTLSNLNNNFGGQNNEPELHAEAHDDHHDDIHHYEVFHVEFARVELPFIIALWIFVSSLAKIGKFFFKFSKSGSTEKGFSRISHDT